MALDNIFSSLKKAQAELALQNRGQKDAALKAVMDAIEKGRGAILKANAADVEKARAGGMKEALVDRLLLNDKRINDIIEGIDTVVRQEDPIGKVQAGWVLPNGLQVERTTVPLGVAAIIYESRPNVTADAFSLAYKAGCGILLRGSSAALESNRSLVKAIKEGLNAGGGISDALALAESGSRDEVDEILSARGKIDVVLPRGGKDLIRRVVENAKIPVIETGEGNCHIYVDSSADIINAVDIIENAKLQKPGACNAVETVLVHRDIAAVLLPLLAKRLAGKVELRCDNFAKAAVGAPPQSLLLKDAAEEDWETEFLDYILAIKTVDTLEEAVTHINRYGTKHSEAILTNDHRAAEEFERRVDAACVYTNASTRFTDGGQFGFGAELGISTQKFHARGPMGLEALTTIKYRIHGTGQIRP
ncbi:glutamate-5-semialdehyde dehydrogenase [Treponema primitia]|uniref:glutamate-5-semialdehyde dehydrogenase n=1 Tax=Treponema primitia TaxID=88058 RepID=UPI003980E89E